MYGPRVFNGNPTMVKFHLNGSAIDFSASPDTPLLWVVRDFFDLTGTKYGCGMALCGACTVHVDGQPTRSCMTPISALGTSKVTTVEAIGADRAGKAVQAAIASTVVTLLVPSADIEIGRAHV